MSQRIITQGWRLAGACAAVGGSSPGAWDYAGSAVANVDFTNLDGFNELMVILRGLTASASGFRVLQASTDNGATFRSTSGDYVLLNAQGTESNTTGVAVQSNPLSTAVTGIIHIPNAGLAGVPKEMTPLNALGGTGTFNALFVQSTNPINALRVVSVGSTGNLNGGSIRVLGR
jgi:hypothetical protein